MKRYTLEKFVELAKNKHGNRYDYSGTIYVSSKIPVTIRCPDHGEFDQFPGNHLRHGCPGCAGNAPLTTEEFIRMAITKHRNTYDYSETKYKSRTKLVTIICRLHGPFTQIAGNHIAKEARGCIKCGRLSCATILSNGTEHFVAEARKVHADHYDYSRVQYVNNCKPVIIGCPVHGWFTQMPANHLRSGCFDCGILRTAKQRFFGTELFIKKAKQKHQGKNYDYTKTIYTGSTNKVNVVCQKHGPFELEAESHMQGIGCPRCGFDFVSGLKRLSMEDFINKAKEAHPNTDYDYSRVHYQSANTPVEIICPVHGPFPQMPSKHWNGYGCPLCGQQSSRGENELASWIESTGAQIKRRDRHTVGREVDILLPKLRLAVEYNGMYWHSTSIENRTNSKETLDHYSKWRACFNAGYQLLIVWEEDWNDRRETIKSWLRHKLGLCQRACSARQAQIETVSAREASAFYSAQHLQGSAKGTHYGLRYKGDLVACMSFSSVSPERGGRLENGVLCLNRFAVTNSVPGAVSRLFAHSLSYLKPAKVVTYSDNAYASGSVYSKLGFTMVAELKPDYKVWHPYYGIRHKSFWQRRNIPRRLKELEIEDCYDPKTDSRTEYDMCALMGCRHIWDCGKRRWEWAA